MPKDCVVTYRASLAAVGKESSFNAGAHLQCRRLRFYPQVGKIPWRRKWQPTPEFLPGKSHGQRRLFVCLQFMQQFHIKYINDYQNNSIYRSDVL